MFALTLCLALAACASTAERPAAAATPASNSAQGSNPAQSTGSRESSSSQAADIDRRNRQFQRAEALYLSGRLKDAAAAFEELTRAYPRDAHIWLKYGNTLTKLGGYDTAATAFQTALNLDPSQGGAALNLALVRLAQAQDALGVAASRLDENSSERAQADNLQRQIKILLGAPDRGAAPH